MILVKFKLFENGLGEENIMFGVGKASDLK
jgi:hypothetical protein